MPAPVFSTFVDAKTKYERQGLLWAHALAGAGVEPDRLRVHHPRGVAPSFLAALRDLGVPAIEVAAHPSGHGYCNKVQQLTHGDWASDEVVVLCDADLLWVDPSDLPLGVFAGKVVDRPNPPEDLWRGILAAAGHRCDDETWVPVDVQLAPSERTPAVNLNGGLYIVPGSDTGPLGTVWNDRIAWLGANEHLLPTHRVHQDQIAMGLALLDLGVAPVLHLDRGWNFPLHLPPEVLAREPVRIRAIHHHDLLDAQGLVEPIGVTWVDEVTRRVNSVLLSMV